MVPNIKHKITSTHFQNVWKTLKACFKFCTKNPHVSDDIHAFGWHQMSPSLLVRPTCEATLLILCAQSHFLQLIMDL
jgi:hypothetical protein